MAKRKSAERKEDFLHSLKVMAAILGLVALILLCYWGFQFGREVFSDEPVTVNKGTHITYELEVFRGESVLQIGHELKKAGIIRDGLAFWAQSKIYECRIGPGVYTVSSKTCSKDLVKYLNQEYENAQKE